MRLPSFRSPCIQDADSFELRTEAHATIRNQHSTPVLTIWKAHLPEKKAWIYEWPLATMIAATQHEKRLYKDMLYDKDNTAYAVYKHVFMILYRLPDIFSQDLHKEEVRIK